MEQKLYRQKEREQEKTLEKKNAVVAMKPDEEAKYLKVLRQPRSRKFMRALKDIDVLSEQDEALMERMRQSIEAETGEIVPVDYVFNQQEIEAFRQSVSENIQKSIVEEIEKEAKRMGDVIEANKKPTLIISPCAITGCVVHSFHPDGSIAKHFTQNEVNGMDHAFRTASDILLKTRGWTSMEIFTSKLVHRSERGDVIKIYDLNEG